MTTEIQTFAPQTAAGALTVSVPFPYIAQSHVKLYINGVEDTAFEWISDGAIVPSLSVVAGDTVVVKRVTPRAALITELPTTGTLKGSDLNEQSLQAVYVATEAADGLREGLALDEATETYWEGAPTGVNRIMKNVTDPVNAQDAATKGWYDAEVTTQTGAAATSAGTAATQAAAAAVSASSASSSASSATTSATTASAAAASATASATSAATSETAASDALTWAENWAIRAEDSLIPVSMGSDGTEYSSYHYAQKASDSEVATANDEALATAVALAARRYRATQLIPNGETGCWAINGRSGTFTALFDTPSVSNYTINRGLPNQIDVHMKSWCDTEFSNNMAHSNPSVGAVSEWNRSGLCESLGITSLCHFHEPENGFGVGYFDGRNPTNYCEVNRGHEPGNTVYSWTRTNIAYSTSHGTQVPFLFTTNPVRLTQDATAGVEHYIQQKWERAAAADVKAGKKMIKFALKYAEANPQRYIKIQWATADDTWSMTIDMLNMTVTATTGTFDAPLFTYELDNGAVIFMREFTVSADSATASNYIRCYMVDTDGTTTTFNGDNASKFYIGLLTIMHGDAYAPMGAFITTSNPYRGSALQMNPGVNSLDTYFPNENATYVHQCTRFQSSYIMSQRGNLGEKTVIMAYPYVAGGRGILPVIDTSGNVVIEYTGDTGGLATIDTGIDITPAGADNNGLGTLVKACLVQSGFPDFKMYIQVNGGTIQTYTGVLNPGGQTAISADYDFMGLNSGATGYLADVLIEYQMYFSREFSTAEVEDLFLL